LPPRIPDPLRQILRQRLKPPSIEELEEDAEETDAPVEEGPEEGTETTVAGDDAEKPPSGVDGFMEKDPTPKNDDYVDLAGKDDEEPAAAKPAAPAITAKTPEKNTFQKAYDDKGNLIYIFERDPTGKVIATTKIDKQSTQHTDPDNNDVVTVTTTTRLHQRRHDKEDGTIEWKADWNSDETVTDRTHPDGKKRVDTLKTQVALRPDGTLKQTIKAEWFTERAKHTTWLFSDPRLVVHSIEGAAEAQKLLAKARSEGRWEKGLTYVAGGAFLTVTIISLSPQVTLIAIAKAGSVAKGVAYVGLLSAGTGGAESMATHYMNNANASGWEIAKKGAHGAVVSGVTGTFAATSIAGKVVSRGIKASGSVVRQLGMNVAHRSSILGRVIGGAGKVIRGAGFHTTVTGVATNMVAAGANMVLGPDTGPSPTVASPPSSGGMPVYRR
jgi:hypothetical protein